jgi:hypothetical protein
MKYEMYRDVVSQVTQELNQCTQTLAGDLCEIRERDLWDVLVALWYAYPDLQEKYAEEVPSE